MIIDTKHPLPDDPTPQDAPPSYEFLGPAPHEHRREKDLHPEASSSTLTSPLSSPSSQTPIAKSPSSASAKGKGRANWFNFGTSRTGREVRNTVLGLVRDMVREHQAHSPAALGILQSCAEAASSHSVSLSSILQEKSIEAHTPLYWAIVKRPPDENLDESTQIPDLLTTLLSYSTPLTPATISDIRLACLITSDQPLFQRLRLSPEFSPVSAVDEMLLGGTVSPDDIVVEDVPGDEGSFAVNFEILHFQKRMMVTKEIELEFIARGRMWKLSFFVAPAGSGVNNGPRPGSWCISLSLLEHSPPTWIDSQLLVPEPISIQSPGKSPGSGASESSPASNSPFSFIRDRAKPRPTISLRLKSTDQLVASNRGYSPRIVVSLEDSLMGTSLQYAGSSYIAPDEKLRARLEARLAKPEAECIIC